MDKAVHVSLLCFASFVTAEAANFRKARVHSVTTAGSSGDVIPPLTIPDDTTPIHLLISAFQDTGRCAATMYRALNNAYKRERVSFSVMQAKGPSDVSCHDEFRDTYVPQLCGERSAACAAKILERVHSWTIALEEGKGPFHQRGLLSERADLPGQGAMCLATDAHMDFIEGWDKVLLADWLATGNEFAVLSTYPEDIDMSAVYKSSPDKAKKEHVELCGYWLSGNIPRGATGVTEVGGDGKPSLTMNWAAGQSFARCHAEKNVPVDKNMMWLFDGEEVNRAVRLWTHGYDLYNPSVSAVLHNYTHAMQNFWQFKDTSEEDGSATASRERLRQLLSGRSGADFGKFGLGNQRTIEQYVKWSHTNLGSWREYLAKQRIQPEYEGVSSQPNSHPEFCRSLSRAPVRDAAELTQAAGV